MCMKSSEKEACEVRTIVTALGNRVTNLEADVKDMKSNVTTGFASVNQSVANLAKEFGTRMNTLDQRIVEEKAKWGETLRDIVKWGVRTILLGAAAAMGVTAYKTILGG